MSVAMRGAAELALPVTVAYVLLNRPSIAGIIVSLRRPKRVWLFSYCAPLSDKIVGKFVLVSFKQMKNSVKDVTDLC